MLSWTSRDMRRETQGQREWGWKIQRGSNRKRDSASSNTHFLRAVLVSMLTVWYLIFSSVCALGNVITAELRLVLKSLPVTIQHFNYAALNQYDMNESLLQTNRWNWEVLVTHLDIKQNITALILHPWIWLITYCMFLLNFMHMWIDVDVLCNVKHNISIVFHV